MLLRREELLRDKKLANGFARINLHNYSQGVAGLLELLDFEDPKCKDNVLKLDLEHLDVVLYPGCGDDISPCAILETTKFEEENLISSSNDHIYIFIDPDEYGMCKSAFELQNGFRNLSSHSIQYTIESHSHISIQIPNMENGIEGYFVQLNLGAKSVPIIYLQMLMRDFLRNIIVTFHIQAKWIFLINMEGRSGERELFDSFSELNAQFPEWICINREEKIKTMSYYPNLNPMTDSNGKLLYEKCDTVVKYGRFDPIGTNTSERVSADSTNDDEPELPMDDY